jgi:predicted HTH transcriptional regulator
MAFTRSGVRSPLSPPPKKLLRQLLLFSAHRLVPRLCHAHPILRTDDEMWIQNVRALPISISQKRALVGFADRDFANADYCELNGVDRDSAYRELHDLVDRGLVVTIGAGVGAGAHYRVQRTAVSSSAPQVATPLDLLEIKMREVGHITNTDFREAFGVERQRATVELGRWIADGVLVREGEGHGTRYRPGKRWPPK